MVSVFFQVNNEFKPSKFKKTPDCLTADESSDFDVSGCIGNLWLYGFFGLHGPDSRGEVFYRST